MDTLNSRVNNKVPGLEATAEKVLDLAGPQVVILADDLTGACDSAAAFLGQGRRACVWLQDGFVGGLSGADVWSFSTDSRNQASTVAADRVRLLADDLVQRFPAATFFKKIDSAGRGCFAEEMEATRVAIGATLTVCAPAFPEAGRCVLNGALHVWDATGRVANIRLREFFPKEMDEQIALISRGTDREVERSAKLAMDENRHVLLCDANSAADLQRIVRVVHQLSQRVLWAGSAGIGFEIARTLKPGISDAVCTSVRRSGKTLVVCGSPHPLTQMQMGRLACAGAVEPADRIIAQVRCGESSEESLRKIFFKDASPVGSLVLTGGDTAAMVLRAFAAESIEVAGQMSTGIPWGIVHGGIADGCIVITKSGGFGDEHMLVNALHFCRGVTA